MAENPPDLQLPPLPNPEGYENTEQWARAMVAAVDGSFSAIYDAVQELSRRIATLEDAP